MTNIFIAPATPDDFEAIYGFVCALANEVFDRESMHGYYKQCLSAPHHHYLMAFANDVPVGYISCHGQLLLHHGGMVYEIEELYVEDKYRSMGIGRQLVRAIEDALAGSGLRSLEVCSNVKRTDAHRFYSNAGFRHTSFKFVKEL